MKPIILGRGTGAVEVDTRPQCRLVTRGIQLMYKTKDPARTMEPRHLCPIRIYSFQCFPGVTECDKT
jgi:hypothetical protein